MVNAYNVRNSIIIGYETKSNGNVGVLGYEGKGQIGNSALKKLSRAPRHHKLLHLHWMP
jgi:hypothetical protein